MRECEKSNSDISGLSAFGPSLDRINNGGTLKKMQEDRYKMPQNYGDNSLGTNGGQIFPHNADMISVTTPNNNMGQQVDASSSYSCNIIPNRMIEKSQSDISAISHSQSAAPVTPPPTKYKRRLQSNAKKGQEGDNVSDISGKSGYSGYSAAYPVQTFNSNKRK